MKSLKFAGAFLCGLLVIGTLPSIYLISKGLVTDEVDEPGYFVGKLVAYIVGVVVLVVVGVFLIRSARSKSA